VIRFTPDGFYDESSVRKIILRQGEGNANALEVVQTANRLGYEIRPATAKTRGREPRQVRKEATVVV